MSLEGKGLEERMLLRRPLAQPTLPPQGDLARLVLPLSQNPKMLPLAHLPQDIVVSLIIPILTRPMALMRVTDTSDPTGVPPLPLSILKDALTLAPTHLVHRALGLASRMWR